MMGRPISTGRASSRPHPLLMLVYALALAGPPLLVGWRASILLDSALLGCVAAAMTILVGISALGAIRPAHQG
jgi:sterol desaturase/sphingolipid hydroxylase (fatty acid hydroxylase superfamily)